VSMANGQEGSVCDELGARDRRHAPPRPVTDVLPTGHESMRLQRYTEGIWATGRRWGRSQARPGLEAGCLDSIRGSDRA